ncbi:MAG: ABC transporter substrate-binding protein [Actinomycetota bacterium]|nr:ABC transporter substrate-binding protein [Actinomycetota bacterium]
MRIVSLLPSATEIAFALGLGEHVYGVTFECDFPAEARGKRVVSRSSLPATADASAREIDSAVTDKVAAGEALYRLDVDAIREIRPDLLLVQDLCKVCAVPSGDVVQALDRIGGTPEVVSLDPSTVDEVIESIATVGRAAGAERRAAELTASLRERVERVRATSAGLEPVPAAAIEWPDPPFAGGHWVPEMIRLAGGRDVLGAEGLPSRRVSWDEVAAAAPEAIAYMPCGYFLHDAADQARRLLDLPEVAATPAARRGNVFALDASAYFSRPGPRIPDGLEILAWALHPEAFAEPPPGRVLRIQPASV